MRASISTWASALLLAAPSVAEDATVYLSGNGATDSSSYHSLNGANDRTIQAINNFGGREPLFTDDSERQRSRGLIVIEGVSSKHDVEIILSKYSKPAFTLTQPPTSDANADFFGDLQAQHSSIHGSRRDWTSTGSLDSVLDSVRSGAHNADYLHHSRELQYVAEDPGVRSAAYKGALDRIIATVGRALSTASSNELTVILMPETAQPKSHFKRAASSSWGSYTKAKRQAGDSFVDDDNSGLVPPPPSNGIDFVSSPPIQAPPPPPAAANPAPPAAAADEVTISQSNDTVTPPRGILPSCFTSRDDCESVTHGCSGHGICQLKYALENKGSCYACACEAEVKEVGKGKYKTTEWGGPACQKKDVSVPLWLLGGTVVSLLFAVIWGIGLLYSMGAEELPSVIGAGVAGIGARSK